MACVLQLRIKLTRSTEQLLANLFHRERILLVQSRGDHRCIYIVILDYFCNMNHGLLIWFVLVLVEAIVRQTTSLEMKLCFDVLRLFLLVSCISRIFTAPIDDKKNERCATAKGSLRSSVEASDSSKSKRVHLLADLDALSHGIKRAATEEEGCSDNADKKMEIKEASVGAVSTSEKRNELTSKEETIVDQIVNDEESTKGSAILETGKAAIRSVINSNATNATAAASNSTAASNSSQMLPSDASAAPNDTTTKSPTNAKTFIARSSTSVVLNNKQLRVPLLRKANVAALTAKPLKLRAEANKNVKLAHRSLHPAIVPDDAPSMQQGSLAKIQEPQSVKASAKSTSSIVGPLNNAIKSLDSATKLLGAAAAGQKLSHTTLDSGLSKSSSKASAAPLESSEFETIPRIANATLAADVASTARSASSGSVSKAASKEASASTASAPSASKAASAPPVASSKPAAASKDPYAEIASGPDSPKTPDLKTGSEKAGLPVMKVDPNSESPEQVSFDKPEEGGPADIAPPVQDSSSSSRRPGPQDVGGILDKLTDRLNKGGSAIEQPLPPTESKSITEQLTTYDNDALATAKGWESNGLRAIEKLKSDEFKHGSLKTELSKELTEKLAGGMDMGEAGAPGMDAGGAGGAEMGRAGYNAALGAGVDGGDMESEQPPPASFGSQPSSQWPQDSMDNLDSEAQREEQPFSQYPQQQGRAAENYADTAPSSFSPDSNAYDRQDISSFLSQASPRDGMDMGASEQQGQYFKRSVILRPLYYYYQHLPYAFKHPYDD
eukprot:gene3239-3720_t